MGTVFDFGTPWHTMYPYCGVTGMYGDYYAKVSIIFVVLNVVLFIFSQVNSMCHTVTQLNMAASRAHYILASHDQPTLSHSHSHPTSKTLVSHSAIYQKLMSSSYLG